MNNSMSAENINDNENPVNSNILTENNDNLNSSVNSLNRLDISCNTSHSAKKVKDETTKLKREEERKKREAEKERLRIEKLEAQKKREEEKERLRLEKLEETKKKEAEKERIRLEKAEEARKKEEERRKKEEEKEKLKLEKLEKEKQRLELINAKNEEKKRKEEEKLKEEEEKRLKENKIRTYFCSYFIKKDPVTQKEDEEKTLRFLPFQLKKNMHLAPMRRRIDYDDQKVKIKETLDKCLLEQENDLNYLRELKQGKQAPRRFPKTLFMSRQEEEDCIELKNGIPRIKVKYLHFDPNEYRRPPYYGTWRKKSNIIKPKNPLGKDETLLDYEVDSDEEWEDVADGESLDKSGDEEDMSDDDEEEDDGFFVPHGHLSDDEIDEENRILEPDLKRAHEKVQREQWENERKKISNVIVTKCIGCLWDERKDGFKELIKYKMVLLNNQIPIFINSPLEKIEDESSLKNSKSKINSNPNQSPSVKSKNKSKVNLNNNQNQPSNSTNQAQSQNTPSIAKFINQISNKKDKIVQNTQASSEQIVFKSNNVAEKRICSDSDESVGKRLKLENLNNTNDVNENKSKKQESGEHNANNNDKENTVVCITLE